MPDLQQSVGHPPSVYHCSFSELLYCFAITALLWVLHALWSLPPPALPASLGHVVSPSQGGLAKALLMPPLVRDFSQWAGAGSAAFSTKQETVTAKE